MALTFGRVVREVFRSNSPVMRVFKLGGEKITAKTGITAKGMKYTKLYNANGELLSWKNTFNGKIRKGRYEKVDPFDMNSGCSTEYLRDNKKLSTIRYTGFESPKRSYEIGDNIGSSVLDRYDPLSPNYEPFSFNTNDPLSTPWDNNLF